MSRTLLQLHFISNLRTIMIKYTNRIVYDFVLSHTNFCKTRLLDGFILHLSILSMQRIFYKRTVFVYEYCQYMCVYTLLQTIDIIPRVSFLYE